MEERQTEAEVLLHHQCPKDLRAKDLRAGDLTSSGPQVPGPKVPVLDECRTHSWTRGSSVASGSLRPFGPVSGSNVARGSSVLYLTRGG